MKNLHYSLLLAVFLTLFGACQELEDGSDEKGDKTPLLESIVLDVDMKSSTATSAVFSTDINLGVASSMPLNVYIRYSLSESMTGDDVKTVKLKSGKSDYEDYAEHNSRWQGAATVSVWREAVMRDWEKRFKWMDNR